MEAPLPAQLSAPLVPHGYEPSGLPQSLFHASRVPGPATPPVSQPRLADGVDSSSAYVSQLPPISISGPPPGVQVQNDGPPPPGEPFAPKQEAQAPPAVRQEVPPPGEEEEEEECLVDSQPICFKENPFLVANRKGKGRPPTERILSGPPVGYGKQGQLQTWMYSKAPSSEPQGMKSPSRDVSYSPTSQPASIHFPSNMAPKENTSTKPGVIQPVSRMWQNPSPVSQDDRSSPNPFQHGPSPVNSQTSPRVPTPPSPDEFPTNIKQAYKAFAAVPHSMAMLDPQQEPFGQRNNIQAKHTSPESPTASGQGSPEQRSFRDRQKYFEIDMKQQTSDNKPKPRVSLVGEDDLKKMKEEEAKKIDLRAQDYLLDEEEEEEEDLVKQMAEMKAQGKVVLDGVEYKVESVGNQSTTSPRRCATPPRHFATPPSSGPSSVDGKGESQRNSLEDSFRTEQRPNSITGLTPVYPGEPSAPIRTAKAERRHQERLRMQSPELAVAPDKDLSPAEKRALEAEKRAMWRAARPYGLEEDVRQYEQDLAKRLYQSRVRASQGGGAPPQPATATQLRMKSLEQDALKAQMVIAKSREGKKRSTLDQLAESPSPAPTPSPTPLEDATPRGVTSPGRLSLSEKKFDYRQFAAIPSAKPVYDIQSPEAADSMQFIDDTSSNPAPPAALEADVPLPVPSSSSLEEMALYSNKRKLRQGRRSLETAVPT